MTTRRGKFNARDRHLQEKSDGKEYSEMCCHRCHNKLWKNSGYFYRVMGTSKWIVFCRVDCAKLHVGKEAKLLSYDQYLAALILSR